MKVVLQILILNMNILYINVKKREKLRNYYSNINFALKIFLKY
jgi:hypothetical protein